MDGQETTQDTRKPSSQHKGDLSAPGGQRAGNKRQSQEIEDEVEKKGGMRGRGEGYLPQRDKGTASGQKGNRHEHTVVYKGTRGNPILG